MKEVTANLNNHRQSPRKVRLVASLIRGKTIVDAKAKLGFVTKRAVSPIHKLLNSAIANAKSMGVPTENLIVKSIGVDGGKILYRRRPVSHGSAHTIHKRTSNIKIVLAEGKIKTINSKLKSKN